MTHNFSSPSIHQISTQTSVTYKMLYNRSLLGRLTIFSLSTLRHNNFFLLDLNNNSVKYRTALSLQPTPFATLVLFSTNTLPSRISASVALPMALYKWYDMKSLRFLLLSHPWTSLYSPIPCHSFSPANHLLIEHQIAHLDMHHLVFGINFQIHTVSSTILVSIHLLIHFSTHICHHPHSRHPSFLHSFTPGQKPTFSTNPSHRRFLLPTGLPYNNGTGPDLSRSSVYF